MTRQRYHLLYKITCAVTGKYYVGMHSTYNPHDRYRGSGQILRASLRKHGRENHVKEIFEFCSSREELLLREHDVINDEMLADPMCMNIVRGGNTSRFSITRNEVSAKLQAKSLRRFYEKQENRDRVSVSVNDSYKRADVRARVAKKLTETQVIEIRKLYATGGLSYDELGAMFGVGGTTIWMIVTRRTWKHVV